MTNLFGSLDIEIWNLFVFWCLGFEISEVLNTRDIVSMDSPSIQCRIIKFNIRVERLESFF